MNAYVVGFLRENDKILLIKKNRPAWQAGKLNGIGGHIEVGETPNEAMVREFAEEAGLKILDWFKSAVMLGQDWIVHVFYAYGPVHQAMSVTSENVLVVRIDRLPANVLPNLRWLIPLCFDKQISAKPVWICYPNKDEKATY